MRNMSHRCFQVEIDRDVDGTWHVDIYDTPYGGQVCALAHLELGRHQGHFDVIQRAAAVMVHHMRRVGR
jgi:hypothetical protein